MRINKHNYEAYLIDFMDGTLDPEMKQELFVFLEAHPEIKEEFEGLEAVNLSDEGNIVFEDKGSLKKNVIAPTANINEENAEEFFIAAVENNLSASESGELKEFIRKNPEQKKTLNLYKSTKVEADLSITYADKKTLKKYPFVVQRRWYYAAASIAAIFLLYVGISFINSEKDPGQNNIAKNTKEVLQKMKPLAPQEIALNKTAAIVVTKREVTAIDLAPYQRFIAETESIQKIRYALNPKIQVASSYKQPAFPGSFQFIDFEPLTFNPNAIQLADASEQQKDSKLKTVWKGLFSQIKGEKRVAEQGTEDKPKKKVGALWVLANIGLQRVNEVTGSNLMINSKSNEEKIAEEHSKPEYEAGRSSN